MAQTLTGTRDAQKTLFREEYIAGFERAGSLLRKTVTTEHQMSGNKVTFLVADTGGATAVTRGSDGLYPARVNNNNQIVLTLKDQTDLPRMNDFDIFASQGPQRQIMYEGSQIVLGRTIDDEILDALDTGTLGNSVTASTDAFGMLMGGIATLGNSNALKDGDVTLVCSTGFLVNLQKNAFFSSADYVTEKRLMNGVVNEFKFYRYMGINILSHTGVSGLGTNAEKCFMYHKDAIGHAIDNDSITPIFGFNEEQNYSWVRCTAYTGSVKLQNTGILQLLHDGSAFAPVTV